MSAPSTHARALAEFRVLMERIGLPHVLVAVSNNPALDLFGATDYIVLEGDNALHEFSAWQTGLDHCRTQVLDRDALLHVFANDTFCHHRVFGGFQIWAFTRAFRHLARRRGPGFAGETFALEAPVRLDGQVFPAWVSTYLFALNRAGLAALGSRVATPRAELDRYVNGRTARWDTAHPHQKPSFQWTSGQPCTNNQPGPLDGGSPGAAPVSPK